MSKAHVGFQVRQHNPWRIWIALALVILLLVITFLMGRAYQSYELSQLSLEQEMLSSRVSELEVRNQNLVRKNAKLTGASKIEHDAYEKVNKSLVEKEKEILELKEQLAFYQGIVSPEQLALGINIQSFELVKKNDHGLYSYKLVLTKRGKSSQYVKGSIDLLLKGQVEGEQKNLGIKEISEAYKENEAKFSFRYFQVFEGEFSLPEQFEPYDVELAIKPTTKNIKNFTETVSWAEALSGGDH
jgi:cell division protein FtsL